MSETQKLFTAAGSSLLVHLVLFLLMALVVRLSPKLSLPLVPDAKPLELTLEREPPKLEVAVIKAESLPNQRRTMLSDGLTKAEKPPEKAAFESDVDTVAASEKPPTGTAMLPSQDGAERPGLEFETKSSRVGPPDKAPAEAVLPAPAPAQPPPKPLFQPTPMPVSTPPPITASPPRPTPRMVEGGIPIPQPAPISTPHPSPTATPITRPTPKTTEVAMLRPTPRALPSQAAPKPATRESGFQRETQQTRIRGGISNRGRSSVAAVGTPKGRYEKIIADSIGSRWYYYVKNRGDLLAIGTVEIRFIVNSDGKPKGIELLSNTSNSALAEVSFQSIMEAEIPPIPPDVAVVLSNNELDMSYTFTIYGTP